MAALPLGFVVCSTILMLFATLSGVSHNDLWLVKIDLAKLSSNSTDSSGAIGPNTNLSANDIGLSSYYEVNVWGCCYPDKAGQRHCTKARFDWASSWLDYNTTGGPDAMEHTIARPDKIKDSLNLFRNISKGAQVALIICLLALGATFIVGTFSHFHPSIASSLSALAWVTVILVCAAAGLVSAMAAIVMDAIENTAKPYGVVGSTGTTFLAIVWIGLVLAIAAAVFWLATACCCVPQRRDRNTKIKYIAGNNAIA